MRKFKVVVTDYEFKSLEIEREIIEKAGGTLVAARCKTEEEVIERCRDADAIINQYAPISRKVIENLLNCKVISRYGVGVNTIDIEAATERGIIVGNVTDYCVEEVSNHAFALLMALSRKLVICNDAVKRGNWDYKSGMPIFRLKGRILGLAGFGQIPQSLARKAEAFGLKVIAYDPYVPDETARQFNVELVDLHTLCMQADFISVHVPLTEQTKGLIGEPQFKLMKRQAVIINTARGPLIDETALLSALQEGKISGAGLDVIETEPISPDHPLLTMENVILTPHAAWYSEEAQEELKRKTAENVVNVLQGRLPDYFVNHEVIRSLPAPF